MVRQDLLLAAASQVVVGGRGTAGGWHGAVARGQLGAPVARGNSGRGLEVAPDANVIAAISDMASAIAAFAAMFQVRKAAQATEAAAYLNLLESYSTVERRTAVSELSSPC